MLDNLEAISCQPIEWREYEIQADLVIGADGHQSWITAEVGEWTRYRASKSGCGFVFRYIDDPLGAAAPDAVQIFRAEGDQVLVLSSCPAGRTIVANMSDIARLDDYKTDPNGAWERMLTCSPALEARVGGATNVSALRNGINQVIPEGAGVCQARFCCLRTVLGSAEQGADSQDGAPAAQRGRTVLTSVRVGADLPVVEDKSRCVVMGFASPG